jgi:translation initiation factor IF-3
VPTLVSSQETSREVGRLDVVPTRPAGSPHRARVRCLAGALHRSGGGRFPCPPPFRVGRQPGFRAAEPGATSRSVTSSSPDTRSDAAIATDEARINDRIRARQVRLIGADGEQLGIRPLPEALAAAREVGLDLVEVAANAEPPVARIMDFGKWKYEQDQRRKESRKKASNVVIKEMKFRPKIDEHDYETKMKHVERFLGEGSKVKLTIMFRGREMAHPEIGRRILERVAERVNDLATIEAAPRQDGRNMTMVLNPIRKPGARPARVQEAPAEAAGA